MSLTSATSNIGVMIQISVLSRPLTLASTRHAHLATACNENARMRAQPDVPMHEAIFALKSRLVLHLDRVPDSLTWVLSHACRLEEISVLQGAQTATIAV
ncbi:hypothetical protein V2G26_010267 [Clonostachys chloroleuca]